jgi:hypothetical protein
MITIWMWLVIISIVSIISIVILILSMCWISAESDRRYAHMQVRASIEEEREKEKVIIYDI